MRARRRGRGSSDPPHRFWLPSRMMRHDAMSNDVSPCERGERRTGAAEEGGQGRTTEVRSTFPGANAVYPPSQAGFWQAAGRVRPRHQSPNERRPSLFTGRPPRSPRRRGASRAARARRRRFGAAVSARLLRPSDGAIRNDQALLLGALLRREDVGVGRRVSPVCGFTGVTSPVQGRAVRLTLR
jgi:hypothetical protein